MQRHLETKRLICIAILLLHFADESVSQISDEDLTVDAGPLGKIRGVLSTTLGSAKRQYVTFLGMRYADSPTGNRRFLPSNRFNGRLNETGDIFHATKEGFSCSQPAVSLPVPQSEDCLTINVYTPNPHAAKENKSLPVIFFIHGGAFTVGQGSGFSGNRLLNRDCVLVTFNYRLGVLGFFSLKTKEVPGNAGLYDALNALRWARDYISYFGGDSEKITIAGQSAGSVIVTHLLASPLAKGLFHGAIGASGSALAAWGTTVDPLDYSLIIAGKSGCYENETGQAPPNEAIIKEVTDCMRNVKASVLVDALYDLQVEERGQGRLGFDAVSPTIQSFDLGESPAYEKILPEHPHDVFQSGRQANVPLMMGSTKHDGSYVLGVVYNRFLKENGYLNDTQFMSKEVVPRIMMALGIPDEYGVYETISKMYLGESRLSGEFCQMYPGLIDLFSVFFFKASSYQTALFHSRINNHTYWYSFDYQGSQTVFPLLFKPTEIPPFSGGITHGDDLMYVFRMSLLDLNAEGYQVSNRVVNFWANFATYGDPTPEISSPEFVKWSPLSEAGDAEFLIINRESKLSHHYEDTWADAGWEMLPSTGTASPTTQIPSNPPTTTTKTPSSSETSTNPTEKPSSTTEGGSSSKLPYVALIVFTLVKLIIFSC